MNHVSLKHDHSSRCKVAVHVVLCVTCEHGCDLGAAARRTAAWTVQRFIAEINIFGCFNKYYYTSSDLYGRLSLHAGVFEHCQMTEKYEMRDTLALCCMMPLA